MGIRGRAGMGARGAAAPGGFAPVGGGGAPVFNPLTISSLKLWLDDRGQTIDTGVGSWADQSASPVAAFANTTDAQQPTTEITVNGFVAPHFLTANVSRLASTATLGNIATAAASHVFAVVRAPVIAPTSTNGLLQASVLAESGGSFSLSLRDAGAGVYEVYGQIDDAVQKKIVGTGFPLDTPVLIEWAHGGGVQMLRIGAAAAVTPVVATGNANPTTGELRLGCNFNASVFANIADAMIISCNALLTADQVNGLRSYVRWKYGLTVAASASLGRLLVAGDSIAIGYSALTGGWRLNTIANLEAMGVACTGVGPYTTGLGNHRAVSGEKASEVTDLQAVIAAYTPDAIVIAWGPNDIGAGDGAVATLAAINARIDDAQAAGIPNSRIFVQSIVKATAGPFAAFAVDYDTVNAALPAACVTQGVTFVDIGAPANSDGVHPTDAGYTNTMQPPIIAAFMTAAGA
jgi:lysophospholipase L1-like esterase